MNDNRNGFEKSGEIDLVDFSENREMEAIREQERIEREKRRRRAEQLRRAEMLRRRKIEQIKQTVMAWGIVALVLIVVIALIMGIVSMFRNDDKNDDKPEIGEFVAEEETDLVNSIFSTDSGIFVPDDAASPVFAAASKMKEEIINASFDAENPVTHGSELSMLTEAYIWNGTADVVEEVKNTVRDFPVYSNGYVWSSEKSMKSPVTKSYLYDTNAAFVSAVCRICLWEGDTSFLDEIDATGEANGDVSVGMTVGQKLDAAVSHFFDSDDYLNGGGVRYNKEDNLVYVLTTDNNGGESGKPSNLFYNYRFGYLDTYNNLAFNQAMQDLVSLYTMAGDKEKVQQYDAVVKANRTAVNRRLYDKSSGRYIGYIDSDSGIHDYGFAAINLLAISSGVADAEQTDSILSWISGERKITLDSLSDNAIVKKLVFPVFNTVKASEIWWDSLSGEYTVGDKVTFGDYWLNGGESALSGNYYMLSNKKGTVNLAKNLVSAFEKGSFALPVGDMSEPGLYYALYASNAVKELFGISTDGKTLCVNPALGTENAGICGVAFSDNSYDIVFNDGTVFVLSDYEEAVRLKIGSFGSKGDVVLTTVEDGKIISSENLKADENGVVSVSKKIGGDVYIKLSEVKTEK